MMISKSNEYWYYVYGFYDPVVNEFYYIGKGSGPRKDVLDRSDRVNERTTLIRSYLKEPLVITMKEALTEKQAFIVERELIDRIGRVDLGTGPLLNATDGGEGMSGILPTTRSIVLIHPYGRKIEHFNSIAEAAKKYGLHAAHLTETARDKRIYNRGFRAMYTEDYLTLSK